MRSKFQFAIGMLWLGPVAMLLQYWLVWDRLPLKVATHFAANGHANGWMSRETAALYPLIPVLPLLLVATVLLSRIRKPDSGSWAILGLFYMIPLALIVINQQIIAFNLGSTPLHGLPIVVAVSVGVALCLMVFLVARRGVALPESDIVADEVHRSRAGALTLLPAVLLFAFVIFGVPDPTVRVVFSSLGLVFLLLAGGTRLGFHYRFTHAGIEVQTLGLRLCSIPREYIRGYQQDSWNGWRGYGIRGVGENRAYVWCNSGVRITTTGGSVFLGHAEPQRLLHDLDVLTGVAR